MKRKEYLDYQEKISFVKENFQRKIKNKLNLTEVQGPLLVDKNSGIQDNLSGVEHPVDVQIKKIPNKQFQIVQSLAKWKRYTLGNYGIEAGDGIVVNMHAIRPDEESLDNLHSVFVDQWDWEKVINEEDRNLEFLKNTVKTIYSCLYETADLLEKEYNIKNSLPENIYFIHSEDLLNEYPHLSAKERENEICKKYGAVFVIGIGRDLSNGKPHDIRAFDYDDWTSDNDGEHYGLNGDILVWNEILNSAFEISSMGIRVDKQALLYQAQLTGKSEVLTTIWHKKLLDGKLPHTIGGGIGQSRVAMLLLKRKHIGEVQASVWPKTFELNKNIL